MKDYSNYLEDCIEYGGEPISKEEFEAIIQEELEVR